ncbi:MAG: DUF1990 domain-containing protein [Myxococcota bacterium]
MFHLRWPDDERVRADLRAVEDAPCTTPHPGLTHTDGATAPPGFVLDDYAVELGRGAPVFASACRALRAFANYPPSFTRVVRLEPTFEVGTVFGTVAAHYGFASMNPCRITHVIDAPDAGRFGFVLGTLPGHGAVGEERFLVVRDPATDSVRYAVQAISRPALWLARLGRPAMRRVQGRFRRESCATMQRWVRAD